MVIMANHMLTKRNALLVPNLVGNLGPDLKSPVKSCSSEPVNVQWSSETIYIRLTIQPCLD